MYLKTFACQDFRNLAQVSIEPHPRFNIVEGRNGQGKTNLLEAIGLLGSFRSFRDAKNRELIGFGASCARIISRVDRRGVEREISVETEGKGKRVRIDGKMLKRRSEYLGHVSIVFFGPDHLKLTKEGPAQRRRFLDRAIFNIWPAYFEECQSYQQALKNRNKLLKDSAQGGIDSDVMASFDREFIRWAARLTWRRNNFLGIYGELFSQTLGELTAGELEGHIAYTVETEVGSATDEAEIVSSFEAVLARSWKTDCHRRYTTVGPHTHDLACTLQGKSARLFASQGQHRAFVLALKIAEMQLVYDQLGIFPILLLDDVSSELDKKRNEDLMNYLNTRPTRGEEMGAQVFITTTDRRWIQLSENKRVFKVLNGIIT